MRLREWTEYWGYLQDVRIDDGTIKLKFREGVTVEIPQSDEELERKLTSMVGHKISILRTDLPHRPYLVKKDEHT